MNPMLMRIYQNAPGPMRDAISTLGGYYLRGWRYGPETERLVMEALERDSWGPDRWNTWREDQLCRMLHHAATEVPYYRDLWSQRRRAGDRSSWECLAHWPVLTKEEVRRAPRAFLADGSHLRALYYEHTSGTTGKPIDLWLSREAIRSWYALCEARWRRWHGIQPTDRWASMGGMLIVPSRRRRPPFWTWNAALNQLYLSPYHLGCEMIPHYLEALKRYHVQVVWGAPSEMSCLAWGALQMERADLKMKVVVTDAEPLTPSKRRILGQAFQCPVRQTYGMSEKVAAAGECEAGRMHIWPEAGCIEVLADDTDEPVPAGRPGRLVCTGLLNKAMPLVRYEVGDRGGVWGHIADCPCGRRLPVLAGIEGRTNELLIAPDGRRVYWLHSAFCHLPVREAQIVQERVDSLRVRYVPTPEFSAQDGRAMIERLQARMGDVDVILEEVGEISRGANGKFVSVICRVPVSNGPPSDEVFWTTL